MGWDLGLVWQGISGLTGTRCGGISGTCPGGGGKKGTPQHLEPAPPSPHCSSLMSGRQQLAKPPSPADLLGEVSHTRESQEPVPC